MRNDTSDVVDGEPGLIDRFSRSCQHRSDSLFINFLARHVYRLQTQVRVLRGDRRLRSPTWHEQDVGVLTIASHVRANDAVGATAMTQHRRPRAVAEKHARISIGP